MATLVQNLANHANAALSTGPRTVVGKARSAVNARTHGLTGRTLIVHDDERETFDKLVVGLHHDLKPEGSLESEIFDQIIQASWNLRRMSRAEADLIDPVLLIDPAIREIDSKRIQLIDLYRSRAERSIYKAMDQLRRLQQERVVRNLTMHPDLLETAPLLPRTTEVRDGLRDQSAQVAAVQQYRTAGTDSTPLPA